MSGRGADFRQYGCESLTNGKCLERKEEEKLRKYLYRIISIGNILNHKLFFELDNCLPLLMMNKDDIFVSFDSEKRLSVRLLYIRSDFVHSKYTAFE